MVITGTTGGGNTPINKEKINWNSTLHERKMVFRIPIVDIPKDQIEEYVREIAKKFKKNTFTIMERQEIYRLIDGERDYQDDTWVKRRTVEGTPDSEKSIAEWLIYMERHLELAKHNIYNLNTEAALADIRKITALGVRAMEIHGAPERQK